MATASLTLQRVQAASKEGKAFLRRVIRDSQDSSRDSDWTVSANEATEWQLKFYRTIKGTIGNPDAEVEVQTDIAVGYPNDRMFGRVKSFSDSAEVYVPRITRLCVHGMDVAVIATFVLDGSSLHMEASAGSTSSSEHGLAFYSLTASMRGLSWSSVSIGSDTVCKDGRPIIRGAIDVD
jgi:hypothetical protein